MAIAVLQFWEPKYASYLQVELFIPLRIQVLWHRLGPFLRLAHLHRGVRVRSSRLILGDEALCAYHCKQQSDDEKIGFGTA